MVTVRQQQPTSFSGAVGLSALCGENTLWLLFMAEVKRITDTTLSVRRVDLETGKLINCLVEWS